MSAGNTADGYSRWGSVTTKRWTPVLVRSMRLSLESMPTTSPAVKTGYSSRPYQQI